MGKGPVSPRQILTYAAVAMLLLVSRPVPATYAAGCALAALGIFFRVWGCGHLRKNVQLITSGPYARVKHPLYLGTFLVACGAILAAGSPRFPSLVVWVVLGPVFLGVFFGYYLPKKRRVEGDRLIEYFGEEAREYVRTVPDFVPSLTRYPKASDLPWDYATFRSNHELGMDLLIAALFLGLWFAKGISPFG